MDRQSQDSAAERTMQDTIIAINSPPLRLHDSLQPSPFRRPTKTPRLKRSNQLPFLIKLFLLIKIHFGIKTNVLSLQEVNMCPLLRELFIGFVSTGMTDHTFPSKRKFQMLFKSWYDNIKVSLKPQLKNLTW